ncbi:sugar transporter, partial [Infundibulicybe gibba]
SGIIASVITMSHYLDRFGDDPSIKGAVVSTFNGGCFFGAAGAGWANDRWGRKRTIQIGCLFALWGCAMQAGASNVATLLVGRIIGGFAIGVLSMTVPLYNTEIAPPQIRGFLVGLTQQMIGIGFIVANWVGYGSQFIDSDTSWRLPLALQMLPAGLLFVGIQFLPFSPRWLLEVGRDDEAREVVYKLHSAHDPETKAAAEQEYNEMYNTIKSEVSIRSRKLSDLWATRAMMRRTMVAVGVQVFCQFTGINVINYFGPQMYVSLGVTGGKALLVQGIYGAIGPIANLFFIIFILDRVGRKKPLMFGAASFVATFSILAAIVATNPPAPVDAAPGSVHVNTTAQRAGIAMIFLTSIFFSLSFGPVSWVLASEVFPTSTRSLGTSVATCANWAFNTLFGQVSPQAMTNIQWKFYLVFVCLNLVDLIVIALFFPETKGKTLEEMSIVFGDEISDAGHRPRIDEKPSLEKGE